MVQKTTDEKVKELMFKFGPLHEVRYQIEDQLKKIPLETGDILYRSSNAIGPLGLPFSRLVSLLSKGKYSHSAIAFIKEDSQFVLEINDQGTVLYRLVDWLDTSYGDDFSIYRLKNIDQDLRDKISQQIQNVLDLDPDYDFTFSDPNKFYCTECVATIYKNVGYPLVDPEYIKDIVSSPIYLILKIGNWFMKLFSNEASLPFDQKLYYVGNENRGMMSSEKTMLVYYYKKSSN
jgi:hypothetical protein